MSLRSKYTLFTAALLAAVVAAVTIMVIRIQREMVHSQSRERLEALMEGVSRISEEALANRDQLMLLSYLLFLQREHPELAHASVTWRGHTAVIGRDRPGLTTLSRAVSGRGRPVTYTVTAPSAGQAAVTATSQGVSVAVPAPATLRVQEAPEEAVAVRLGFVTRMLEAEMEGVLTPLLRRTLAIGAGFMLLGMLGAAALARRLSQPLMALAAAASSVGKGNLDVEVPSKGKDEIALLAGRFNEMTASLKSLMRFREDILHTITHELNSPLGGLKAYLELWREGKVPADSQEEALGTMSAAALQMEQSLQSALQLFRSEHRGIIPGPQSVVWVDEAIRKTLRLFAPVIQSKGLRLQIPSATQTAYVIADDELVRQVVSNLVSNALKYTPDGGEVRIGISETADTLTFWVADTGPGIVSEDIIRIFDKFERPVSADKTGRRIPGTGLGLNIARRAVEAMGGRIWVESKVGQGSTFFVSLPKAGRPKGEGV